MDAVAEARRAAEKAGLSLRDWLDAVIDGSVDEVDPPRPVPVDRTTPRDRSAVRGRTGVHSIEARLDELEERLSRGSRDPSLQETATALTDRFAPGRGAEASRKAVERRLSRLVDAIGSDLPLEREEASEAMRAVAGRLDRLGGSVARDDIERRAARDTVRQLEERLEEIARRMETPARPPLAPSRPSGPNPGPAAAGAARDARISPAPIDGLKEAIAEIASRQKTLESEFDRTVAGYADRIDHRLDSVAERLERTIDDASPKAALRDLTTEIRTVGYNSDSTLATEFGELRRLVGDLAGLIDTMPGRMAEDFAGRLDDTARRLDTATRSELDAIRGELREIAQDLDRSTRSEFHALRSELRELAGRVERTPAPAMPNLEAMIEDVAMRLDTAARNEFAEIRAEIREIARAIDQAGRSEYESLRGEIQALGERLGREDRDGRATALQQESGLAELEAIRSEIRSLSEQIDSVRQADYTALRGEMQALGERVGSAPAGRMVELERHLGMLTEKLAGAARDGDPAALAQIERQITRLAEQVDASSRHMAGLDGLESTLSSLFARLEESRVEAMEAAHAAAQDAVDRALVSLQDAGDRSGIFDALKAELAEQRSHAEAADRRTEETLRAVHETLKKIVDRLEELEDEVVEVAGAAPRSTPGSTPGAAIRPAGEEAGTLVRASEAGVEAHTPHGEPDDIVNRINAVTRAFREDVPSDPADDLPLAPGTRTPMTSVLEPGHAAGGDAPEGKADFVAVARRAAQAAASESLAGDVPAEPRSAQRLASAGSLLARYRRPLAIFFAMLILIYGAMKLAAYLRSDPAVLSLLDAAPEAAIEAPDPAPRAEAAARPKAATKPVRQIEPAAEANADATGSVPDPAAAEAPAEAPAPVAAAARPAPVAEPAPALPEAIGSQRLREAAAAGDPAAQFEVAIRYMDGRGTAQDYARAAQWYRLAAAQGLAPAQYRLGSMYEKGQGVGRDTAMARMWYLRAAEQGNRKAMHNLAVLYADGIDGTPDYEKAATWFRQAAEHGLADSQYNLAILYARGLGVGTDLAEAFRWFAVAADQGDAEALAKRDEVARALDEPQLAKARAALDAWTPKTPDPSANIVAEPQGGWGDERPVRQALSTREIVATVQSLLTQLGYAPGPADGEMGPRTRDAIRAFQRSIGMPDTGEVTPELVERLSSSAS